MDETKKDTEEKNKALQNYASLLKQRWNTMNPQNLSEFYYAEKEKLDNVANSTLRPLKIEDYGTRCVVLGKFLEMERKKMQEKEEASKVLEEEKIRKVEEDKQRREDDQVLAIFDRRDESR